MKSRYVMETVESMTPAEANKWCTELHQWIDRNHPHMLERETMRKLVDQSNYWRNAYWGLIYNRQYCPAELYLPMQELDQLRELNVTQASRIMSLDFEVKEFKQYLEEEALTIQFKSWLNAKTEEARRILGLEA